MPALDFMRWQLDAPHVVCSQAGVYPMVPYNQFDIFNPTDSEMEKMAVDAEEKEVFFPQG